MKEQWIADDAGVAALAAAMESVSVLAVDTEADSLHHYREQLCLVQVAVGKDSYLVDPLAQISLNPLWEKMASREWILQGADYDIRMVRRGGGRPPERIFDTLIAAQLLGYTGMSYAALVERFFGVVICKKNQKADWSIRPLNESMREYAAQDVIYLEEIKARLEGELNELGRLEWHRQSCRRTLAQATNAVEETDEERWMLTGHTKLSPRGRAMLKSLWHWREVEAETVDLPVFKVVNNDFLTDFSLQWDQTRRYQIPHYIRGPRREKFLQAIVRGEKSEEIPFERQRREARDLAMERRFDEIKKKRDEQAVVLKIDPGVLASKNLLMDLARNPETAPQRLIQENRWCLWQAEVLGCQTR